MVQNMNLFLEGLEFLDEIRCSSACLVVPVERLAVLYVRVEMLIVVRNAIVSF